jgi:mycothiol system anti-sigma-R factor
MAGRDCDDALHELYSFIDGELTDDVRTRIRQHLEDCPPCFERYDFEAELKLVIGEKCRERVPDGLKDRILDALRAERTD